MNKKAFRHCFSACSQFKKHYKMHKHNKEWIVLPVIALGLLGASVTGVHCLSAMNNVPNVAASGHRHPLQGGNNFNPITNYDDYYKNGKQPANFRVLHTNHVQVLSGYAKPVKHREVYNSYVNADTAPHFWNIMGPGVTFPLNLNSASSTPEKNKEITVKWNDGASYNGQKLDVELTIPMSSVYNYTARNGQHHIDQLVPGYSVPYQSGNYIYVSHDFARGIRYSGFDEAKAHFQFYKAGTNQPYNIPNALLSFDSLNGIGTADASDETNSYDSYVFHDKYNNDYGNNFLTGEFTNYLTNSSTPALIQDKKPGSNIYNYESSLFNGQDINGGIQAPDRDNDVDSYGYKGGQFHDVLEAAMEGHRRLPTGPYFWLNSMLFPAYDSSTQDFYFGSGVGYAWWTLSSHAYGNSKLMKSTTQEDSPDKDKTETGKDNVLHLNKDKPYEYTIQGQVPTSGNDYRLIDKVPGQAKVTGVHFGDDTNSGQPSDKDGSSLSKDVKPISHGNDVSMELNSNQIQANSGKKYTLTVDADVNEPEVEKTHINKFTNTAHTTIDGKSPENSSATDEVNNPKPIIPTPIKATTNNSAGVNETTSDNDNESNHLSDSGSTNYVYYIHGQFPKGITTSSDKDYYDLSDNLPSDVTPDGSPKVTIDGHDENSLADGPANDPGLHLNGSQLDNDQGQKYTLAIPVKDNYQGNDSTSKDTVVHHIHNQANVTTEINNGSPIHQPTNSVVNWYQTSGHPEPKIPPHHLLKTNTHPILSHPGEKYTYDITTPDGVPDRDKYDKQGLDSASNGNWDLFKTFVKDNSQDVDEAPINSQRGASSAYPSRGTGDTGHFDPQYEHEQHGEPNPNDEDKPTQYNAAEALDWPAYNDANSSDFQDKTPAWWNETNNGEPATTYTTTEQKATGYNRRTHKTTYTEVTSTHSRNDAAPSGTFDVFHPYTSSGYLHAYDSHASDNYTVTDQVPGEDTIDDARLIDTTTGKSIDTNHKGDVQILQGDAVQGHKATNLPNEVNGRTANLIGYSLTPYQMAEYSNDHLDLKIHVKANHLNRPNGSGWHEIGNKTRNGNDDYTEDNRHNNSDEGNEAYMSDEVMGKYDYAHTQRVYNKIKVINYHNHWYDYNMHGDKDYIPAQQAEHSGYNDQFNRNWQGDPDSPDNANDLNHQIPGQEPNNEVPNDEWVQPMDKTQTDDPHHDSDTDPTPDYRQYKAGDGYAYFGSRLRIPVNQSFTYKDPVTGKTDKYRFGYDEAKKYEYTTVGANPEHYGNDSWVYAHQDNNRPVQGQDGGNGIPTLDDEDFNEAYYKPYMVPKVTTSPKTNRFIVDTDKKENGLPFRLDLDLNSYRNVLFDKLNSMNGWKNDFQGYKMHIVVKDSSNNQTLYDNKDNEDDLESVLRKGYQRHSIFEKRGVLNTKDDSGIPSGKAGYGDSVPLHVSVKFDDTDGREAEVDPLFMTSDGYIADQYNFTNASFNQGKFAEHESPERTIEYGGSNKTFPQSEDGDNDNHRIQKEEMVLDQDHTRPATFTTGYGLRSDLGPVTYYGLIGTDAGSANAHNNQYDNNHYDSWADGDANSSSSRYQSQLKDSTTMDFAFPKEFDKDTDVNYDDNLPYGATSGQRSNMHSANLDDRLELSDTHFDMQPFETPTDQDENMPTGRDGKHLDTLEDSSSKDNDELIDNYFDNGQPVNDNDQGTYTTEDGEDSEFAGDNYASLQTENTPEHLQSGNYSTNYKFYPRKVYRDSGTSALLSDSSDPLANGSGDNSSNVITKLNNSAINRLFTPYWLPLSTGNNSQNMDYNTVFEKARPSYDGANGDKQTSSMTSNDERLGGNFFNIEDSRADEAVGHMMVADNAPDDGQRSSKQLESDQLHSGESIQPVLGGHNSNTDPTDDDSNNIGQHVSGFSSFANKWVRFVHNWRSLF